MKFWSSRIVLADNRFQRRFCNRNGSYFLRISCPMTVCHRFWLSSFRVKWFFPNWAALNWARAVEEPHRLGNLGLVQKNTRELKS